MTVDLVEHDSIEDDVAEIHRYIARDNPDAALQVVQSVRRGFSEIETTPKIGPRYENPFPHLAKLRMYPVPDFRHTSSSISKTSPKEN